MAGHGFSPARLSPGCVHLLWRYCGGGEAVWHDPDGPGTGAVSETAGAGESRCVDTEPGLGPPRHYQPAEILSALTSPMPCCRRAPAVARTVRVWRCGVLRQPRLVRLFLAQSDPRYAY